MIVIDCDVVMVCLSCDNVVRRGGGGGGSIGDE